MRRLGLFAALALGACNEEARDKSEEDLGSEGAGEVGSAEANAEAGSDDGAQTETVLDVGGDERGDGADDGGGSCGCGLSNLDFSYIWVAHPAEGTISKINTRTLAIEGRYLTSPQGTGNPSRTSVNLNGDVAVANRSQPLGLFSEGGVTKILATPERCAAFTGKSVSDLRTSTNETPLPWGQDDCVAWHVPFVTSSNRPVAWTGGERVEGTCETVGEQLWTAFTPLDQPGTTVLLLDGEDGSEVNRQHVPNFQGGPAGAYGGAVDSKGNLWVVPNSVDFLGEDVSLMLVQRADFVPRLFPVPGFGSSYGITVDHADRVWLTDPGGGMHRFVLQSTRWDHTSGGAAGWSGATADASGRVWYGTHDGEVVPVDSANMAVGDAIKVTGASDIKGVSVDVDGNIWAVDGNAAFRVDPDTQDVERINLGETYTYSDMTGVALQGVACPQPG